MCPILGENERHVELVLLLPILVVVVVVVTALVQAAPARGKGQAPEASEPFSKPGGGGQSA